MTFSKFYKKLSQFEGSPIEEEEKEQESPFIEYNDIRQRHGKHCCIWSRYHSLFMILSACLMTILVSLLVAAYTTLKPTEFDCARQLSTYCE